MNQNLLSLDNVTVVCIDCYNYGKSVSAIKETLTRIKPKRALFLTDIDIKYDGIDVVQIPSIKSKEQYSEFCIKELYKYIETEFCLIIQWDGYVIDEKAWDFSFLYYDYIGAPWLYSDGRNVGNGGFSLRSKKLLDILAKDPEILPLHPEDDCICRTYRPYLEKKYGIKFAPEDLADAFSFELKEPIKPSFGFHGNFRGKYQPYVLIKRTGALGDVILVEPVMRYFVSKGYNVVLDTLPEIFNVFAGHYYNIKHISQIDVTRIKFEKRFDLDMSYESKPKQNRLKTYFEFCNISDAELSRPVLYPIVTEATKLFKKYAILHIDQKEMPYRNVYGVKWSAVVKHLTKLGYTVLQIGKEKHETVALEINTSSIGFLKFLIGGCDLFIGIDSGPLNIAMAYNKPCVGFFGSVNPNIVYPNLKNLEVIQQPCEFQHCYHEKENTVVGVDCVFDKQKPPCCISGSFQVLEAIEKIINQK